MEVSLAQIRMALDEFITEIFKGFQRSPTNIGNQIVAKLYIRNQFEKHGSFLANERGCISVQDIDEVVIPALQELDIIKIPAMRKEYTLSRNDLFALVEKIKAKAGEVVNAV